MSKGTLSHRKILAERCQEATKKYPIMPHIMGYFLERDVIVWLKSRKTVDVDKLSQEEFDKEFEEYLEYKRKEIKEFYNTVGVDYENWKIL